VSTVLVTGGAGAIGGNLVHALVADGHRVVVLDDLSSGRADNLPPDVDLVVGSVVDESDVVSAFKSQPTLVVHLAALFANQNSVDHPVQDALVSGVGTLQVLEHARLRGVEKVVVCSSSCIYGSHGSDVDVPVPMVDDTPYAMTKALAESYARFYARHHGLPTVVLRPFNVYGPGERPGRYRNVIPNFLALALAGEPLPITGTGEETRDFTYVDDAVRAFLLALQRPTLPGSAFNVASGAEVTIAALAKKINAITGNPGGVVLQPRRAWDRTASRVGDISRTRDELGFEPAVTLDDGLTTTAAWLRTLGG
jgi:UDP-glucose 4-epimerase